MKKVVTLLVLLKLSFSMYGQIKTTVNNKAFLLDNCIQEAQVIKKLKSGSTIIFLKADDKNPAFYYIDYNGIKGYIHSSVVNQTAEIKNFISHYNDSIEYSKKEQKRLNDLAQKRAKSVGDSIRLQSLIKQYGDFYGPFVFYKKVVIGMNQDMVLECWGNPENKNVSKYTFGTHEQWVYGLGKYVYFENKIVTAIQSSNK